MYKLRSYQEEAVSIAVNKLKNYKRPFIIQMATGAGKSIVIAEICHRLDEPVLILQPSKELLEQNYSKLISYGIDDVTMYSASVGKKEIGKFTYATIGSIYKIPNEFKHFKYILIDECDQGTGNGGRLRSFIKAIGCENVCGLTATPYRTEQKYFKEKNGMLTCTASLKMLNRQPPFFWKQIAYKMETQQLIDEGYLSPIKYYSDKIDTSDLVVNSTGADYTTESLEKYADKGLNRMVEVVNNIHQRKMANKILVFASSIRRAERAKELLLDNDVVAEVVTGKTPKKERERIVQGFRDGTVDVILNVGVFIAGFDVPDLDCVVYARPTMSVRVWQQSLGRGVRLDPANRDKVLQVFDLTGCVQSLGRIETIMLGKEEDGYRDMVSSEVGRLDEKPLYSFVVKK